MSVSPAQIVQQSPECLTADVNDEAVIMAVETGRYISLDPISKDIWRMIEEPRSVADLCARLAADYDAPPKAIEADVRDFLDFMVTAEAVRIVG